MTITRGLVYEDSAATLLDQVRLNGSTNITAADFSSIVVSSFDMDTGLLVKTTSMTLADVVTTAAVADGWSRDRVGRNVVIDLDGSHWPNGGRAYRIEVTYTPDDDNPFASIYELQCIEVMGS